MAPRSTEQTTKSQTRTVRAKMENCFVYFARPQQKQKKFRGKFPLKNKFSSLRFLFIFISRTFNWQIFFVFNNFFLFLRLKGAQQSNREARAARNAGKSIGKAQVQLHVLFQARFCVDFLYKLSKVAQKSARKTKKANESWATDRFLLIRASFNKFQANLGNFSKLKNVLMNFS